MRFNDPSHLTRWRERGEFPAIHDAIFAMLRKHLDAGTAGLPPTGFLDLCCSIGLLGQRIREKVPGARVCGVEVLPASVQQARAAGVAYPILQTTVAPATLPALVAWVHLHRVEVLIARRCLSELFATDQSWGPSFWSAMTGAGVRMAVLQGRAPCANPTNPLPSVREEIAALGPDARVVELSGQCAVLVPNR